MNNKINRKLVKKQARAIISQRVFYIFIITLVVLALTSINQIEDVFSGKTTFQQVSRIVENQLEGRNIFDGFDDDLELGEFMYEDSSDVSVGTKLKTLITRVSSLASVFLAPLEVALAGFYLSLVRRKNEPIKLGDELSKIFRNAFDSKYLNKLLVVFIRDVVTAVLLVLFIVPGVIYALSTYFAYQLMCDYPHLSASDALKLSRKMVKGYRTELFVLSLSFIPWDLLCIITAGVAGIYVNPYVRTVDALYYENFLRRALADGRVTPSEFMSAEQLAADIRYNPNGYYNVQPSAPQSQPIPAQPTENNYFYKPESKADEAVETVETVVEEVNETPTEEAVDVQQDSPIEEATDIQEDSPTEEAVDIQEESENNNE